MLTDEFINRDWPEDHIGMVIMMAEACLIASALAVIDVHDHWSVGISDVWEAMDAIGAHNRVRIMTACWSEALFAVAGYMDSQESATNKAAPLGLPVVVDVTLASRYANETFDSLADNDLITIETEPDARPNHLAMRGFTFLMSSSEAKDDSVWPPYGFRCRCRARRTPSGRPSGPKPNGGGNDSGFKGGPNHPYLTDRAKAWTASVGLDYHGQRGLTDLGDGFVDMARYSATDADLQMYVEDRIDWFDDDLAYVIDTKGEPPVGMSDPEYQAVSWYTGNGFSLLNATLRSGTPEYRYALANTAKVTASGIARYAPHVGTVYRGTALTRENLAEYKVGARLVEPSFLSTSRSRDVADRFVGNGHTGIKTTYVIESKTGRDISRISEFEDEQEIAFLPGSGFRVTSVHEQNGEATIELEEL